MVGRQLIRLRASVLAAAAVASVLAVGARPADAAPTAAPPDTTAARVVIYDATGAGEFVDAVHQGADNWNNRVSNVRLQRARPGDRVNVVVVVDNNWPRAAVRSLGNGRIWMGRQAVDQGHFPPRIAAHEFGHILGLPDRRTGRCSDLMSGASGGTSCRNAFPNSREIREVEANFAGSVAVSASFNEQYHVWECLPASGSARIPAGFGARDASFP